jgi:hypothetical protein
MVKNKMADHRKTTLFKWSANLDSLTNKIIFFLFSKWFMLMDNSKTGQICPVFNGLILGCPVPAEIDHLNTGLD